MEETLKHKTVKGTLWSALERFSVQGITFVVMIIMANLLTPDDYGLVGMLTIFISISQALVDSGFSNALIRKRERTEADNSTVFYFNIVTALLLYLILFFTAPLIAHFYGRQELVAMTRLISLSIVINSLVVVQRALFTVKIDFKTQAKASLTAAVLSGLVGIGLAYSGFGVWSIVWYQLVNLSVNASLLWLFSAWRPRLIYSWQSFRELFSYGSKLAISAIIDSLYNNIYLIVIGKIFKAADLGYYTRAQQFAQFPSSNATGIIQRVTFPALCTLQDDDERLAEVYRRFLRLSAFVIFPLMLGLSAVARPLILVLLKEEWLFTATLLQIICFAMMWYPVHAINLNLLQVKGRSDLFLRLEIIKKCIGVSILCVTVPMGLIAMCCGTIVSSLICLVINTHYTGKLIKVGFLAQMRDLLPTLCCSLAMWGIIWLATWPIENKWLQLSVGIMAGFVFYLAMAVIVCPRELRELKSMRKP